MKRLSWLGSLIVVACIAALGQAPNTKVDAHSKDELSIRKLIGDLLVAWNRHDVVAFSTLFAEDADFTNWRADVKVRGREAIKEAHTGLFAGMFRLSKLNAVSTRVRFLAPDVAAVDCEWQLIGAIDYDGKGTIPPRTYFPLLIVTKTNGDWFIAVMHNILFQPLPVGATTGPVKP